MRGKLIFGAGVGIGYVLGTRAGRERFDQITSQAKRQTIEQYRLRDGDTGSPEVQVALLTQRINDLS